MNESVAMLGVLAAAAWAVFGCLYARMSWSGGAPIEIRRGSREQYF